MNRSEHPLRVEAGSLSETLGLIEEGLARLEQLKGDFSSERINRVQESIRRSVESITGFNTAEANGDDRQEFARMTEDLLQTVNTMVEALTITKQAFDKTDTLMAGLKNKVNQI